jgi:hypothetical protein
MNSGPLHVQEPKQATQQRMLYVYMYDTLWFMKQHLKIEGQDDLGFLCCCCHLVSSLPT